MVRPGYYSADTDQIRFEAEDAVPTPGTVSYRNYTRWFYRCPPGGKIVIWLKHLVKGRSLEETGSKLTFAERKKLHPFFLYLFIFIHLSLYDVMRNKCFISIIAHVF